MKPLQPLSPRALEGMASRMGAAEGIIYRTIKERKLEGTWLYNLTHNDNKNYFDVSHYKSPYPNVKLPSINFIGIVILEHPYCSLDEIIHHLKLRMKIRNARPDLYRTPELARGDEYLPDFYEEFKEELLDSEQLERLKRQRARREKIGTITSCYWDTKRELLIYDVMVEECDDWEPPITRAKHLQLLNREREDI